MDIKTTIQDVHDPACRERDCRSHILFRWQATIAAIDPDRVEILDVDLRWRLKGEDPHVSRAQIPPIRPIRFAPVPFGAIYVHHWLRSDIEGNWCANDAPLRVPAAPVCITEMRQISHPCHCGAFALRHPEGLAQKT